MLATSPYIIYVKQEIAVQEAERIATIAAKVKAKLFEVEVEE